MVCRARWVCLLLILLVWGRCAWAAGPDEPLPDSSADTMPRAIETRPRPAPLVPLYISFAALQAVDAHSTWTAVGNGARESNPLVRGTLGSPAGLLLLKGGTAVGVVLLTERLWPHHRAAAVISMIAFNVGYGLVAAHNYRAAAVVR